ncbi:MAG: hypothetical protein U9Q06_03135 [Nanoarchaeota archaeon]|nr:hypothetical protein [Nanoarchaeota archaeon]
MGEDNLDREIEFFQEQLPQLLLTCLGKYVLVRGECLSVYEDERDAINQGHERYNGKSFLVKRIVGWEGSATFTQDLD